MRLILLIAPLAAAALLSGCGSAKSTSPTTAPARTATGVTHAAPALEALLPSKIDGKKLTKGSTTGAVVFGGDAFSRSLGRFLASVGKSPHDLRFANAQSQPLDLETGVFQVPGVHGTALAKAIVAASRPNAPGLRSATADLSGKRVTRVVYPGGSVLYLYPRGGLVFYVGTPDEKLAERVLGMLPATATAP